MTDPGQQAAPRRPAASGYVRPVAAVAAALVAVLTLLTVLSVVVTAGRTVGFDDGAQEWFWSSGQWGWPQRVCDVVVEGLQPRVILPLFLVAAAITARRHRSALPFLLAGMAVALLASGLLVLRAGVTRVDMHGVDGSYPSGHEASMVVAAGTLVLVGRWPRSRLRAVVGPVALALMMGAALLVTGTHWCTDVLGGALLGLAVLGTVALVALGAGWAGLDGLRSGSVQTSARARSRWSATSAR